MIELFTPISLATELELHLAEGERGVLPREAVVATVALVHFVGGAVIDESFVTHPSE